MGVRTMRESAVTWVVLHAENWLVSKPTYYAGIQMECLNKITRQLSLNVATTASPALDVLWDAGGKKIKKKRRK